MLSFSNSQSVENVWLSQEVTVPSEYPAFSIRYYTVPVVVQYMHNRESYKHFVSAMCVCRGRLRHSTIDMEAVAVIQV